MNLERPVLADLFVSAAKTVADEGEDEDIDDPMDILMPYLKTYGIVIRSATSREVHEKDLRDLAGRWQLKTKDPKTMKERKREDLIMLLIETAAAKSRLANATYTAHSAAAAAAHDGFKTKKGGTMEMSQSLDTLKPKKKKKLKNYFGLPDFAYEASPAALVYKGRKATELEDEETQRLKRLARMAAALGNNSPTGDGGGTKHNTDHADLAQAKADKLLQKKFEEAQRLAEARARASKNVAAQLKVCH